MTHLHDKKEIKANTINKSDFGHYDWYFGSAEYLDTATQKQNKKIFSIVNTINEAGGNYVYIINSKGEMLLNNLKLDFKTIELFRKNALSKINKITEEDGDFFTYDWLNKKTNKIEKKYAYIKKIPNSDWMVGSGIFLSDLEEKLEETEKSIYTTYNLESKDLFYTSIILLILSLIVSFYVSKTIKKSYSKYKKDILDKKNQLKAVNQNLEKKVAHRTKELERLKNKFKDLATTDSLTQVHNRYSLTQILATEIIHSKRYNSPLSIIMYDIDFFKMINDKYGHDIGDNVLVSLSELVKSNIRKTDSLGRFGGEEFIIVLPNTALDDATYYAQRLRQIVQDFQFKDIHNLTISIGVAQLQENENVDELYKRVDKLLYNSRVFKIPCQLQSVT